MQKRKIYCICQKKKKKVFCYPLRTLKPFEAITFSISNPINLSFSQTKKISMSTSKLALYKTLLFRNPRIQPLSTKLNNPFLFFKPPLHQNHRHHTSFSSFSTSTAAAQEETLSSTVHPWPEWISFVDRLTAKGYLSKSADDNSVYSDINLLKDASLSFARDRYDVFKFVFFPFFIELINCFVS